MRLELGGGDFNKGGDWTNMDLNPVADIVHDLESFPYPQADESVDELYSSHCLEHLVDPIGVMNEISRICKVGARVEIRVPHPNSNHAMCAGHKHVFGPMVVRNCDHHFPHLTWSGQRRLFHQSTNYGACELLAEARRDLPFLAAISDEKVMKWIPGTCHECCFHFVVGVNPTPFKQTGFNGAALDYLDT